MSRPASGPAGHDEPAHRSSLDTMEDKAWTMMEEAVGAPDDPVRTPVLATAGPDGRPEARIVVLRAVDRAGRILRVNTDVRSAKMAQIEREPRVTLVFFDPEITAQIRIRGEVEVLRDPDLLADAWHKSEIGIRPVYMATVPPGTKADGPVTGLPPGIAGRTDLTEDETSSGLANFVVLYVHVKELEWLHIGDTGHRRALVTYAPGGKEATWLVP